MKLICWCQELFSNIHKIRSRTLGVLVEALIRGNHLGVCSLGRNIVSNTSIKHNIKRVHRFISNENVKVYNFLEIFLSYFTRISNTMILVVDWTKIRERPVLCCGLVSKGRVIPVYWKIAKTDRDYDQNRIEDILFHDLRDLIPKRIKTIIIADRGFHRSSLLRLLDSLGFKYVIRQPCTPYIKSDDYTGRLKDLVLTRGIAIDIPFCRIKKKWESLCRIVALHDFNQKEAWFLSTNIFDLTSKQVIKLYNYRFRIEETFRDIRGVRGGWHLKQIGVKDSERLSRLLLISAIAYYFIMLSGIITVEQNRQRNLASCNRKKKVFKSFSDRKNYYFKIIP